MTVPSANAPRLRCRLRTIVRRRNTTKRMLRRRAVRRSFLPIAAVLVLVPALAGLGAGAGILLAPDAEAEATVFVTPLPGNAFSGLVRDPSEDLTTEAQLARSDAVLERVAAVEELELTVDQLRRRTRVSVVSSSQVFVLSFAAGSAAHADAVVRAIADSFLEVRTERAERAVSAQRAALTPRVQSAQNRLSDAINGERDRDEIRVLSRRLAVLRGQLRDLAGAGKDSGSVVRVVARPGSGVALATALGIFGAVGGATVGLLVWRLQQRGRGIPARQPSLILPARGRRAADTSVACGAVPVSDT